MQIHLSLFLFICIASSGWSDIIFLAQNPSHLFLIFEGAAGATSSGKLIIETVLLLPQSSYIHEVKVHMVLFVF